MSIRYNDKNNVETICSGITPGGDIEAGAVATRSGTISVSPLEVGAYQVVNVAFDTPMPDNTYIINIDCTSGRLNIATFNKTANGFSIVYLNSSNLTQPQGDSIVWTATKTYTVQHAAQTAADIADIKAMIPSSASSTNKFSTADDLRTETRALDRRLDDVEDVVPTSASITNQLATQNDLSNIEIDELGEINDVDLTNLADGQTLVWDDANSKWVNGQGGKVYTAGNGINISGTDEISTNTDNTSVVIGNNKELKVANTYKTIFVGTRAQWDALSTADKVKYNEAHITDDVIGGEVADVVQDGLMSPVTSNAVYDNIKNVLNYHYGETTTFSPGIVAGLEQGFQNAANYSIFQYSSQANEEAGFFGFKHTVNKTCYAIGMSSAIGIVACRRTADGVWSFTRLSK